MNIKFEIDPRSGHVHVPVMINGKGPFTFTLDTGASATTISKSLADQMGIEIYEGEKKQAGGAGGKLIPVQAAKPQKFTIGDETFVNEEVGVIDFEAIFGDIGRLTDGVIGHTMLKHYLLTIDYASSTITLTKGTESSVNGVNWTSFKYVGDSHLVLVPVFVNDQGPIDLVLDTGSGGNIITPSVAEDIGIAQNKPESPTGSGGFSDGECRGVGGVVTGYGVTVERLSVAGKSQSDIMVGIIDLKVMSPTGKKIDFGIIGYPFLKDFRLLLDYPNQRFALIDQREN